MEQDESSTSSKTLFENLSSEVLFTFTSKREYLISMLENGIMPRYIYERLPIRGKTWYYIIAAKCFCDIPLGKIKSHLNWFGNYGLGLNKKYLREFGVTPILYIHQNSHWITEALNKKGLENIKEYPTLPFLKRYNGDDYKREENGSYTPKKRKFYDEREWRFVPKDNALEVNEGLKIENGIDHVWNKNRVSQYNTAESCINISPNIVEYIIIDNFNEFGLIRKDLRRLYPNDDEYDLMLSKILIADRIIRDF